MFTLSFEINHDRYGIRCVLVDDTTDLLSCRSARATDDDGEDLECRLFTHGNAPLCMP